MGFRSAVDDGHRQQKQDAQQGRDHQKRHPQIFQGVQPDELPRWFGDFQARHRGFPERRGDGQRQQADQHENAGSRAIQINQVTAEGDFLPGFRLFRERRQLMILDVKQVQSDQRNGEQGEQADVPHIDAAQQRHPLRELFGERQAEDTHALRHPQKMREGLVRLLVPLQHGAGKQQADHHQQQAHADIPVDLARRLVRSGERDADHVEQEGDSQHLPRPEMNAPQKPAEPHLVDQVMQAGVGAVGVRHVKLGQQESA